MKRWLCAAALAAWGVAAPVPAFAQAAPDLDIRLERDTRPGILSSALVVNLKLTVTDRETARPPQDAFEVYAHAQQAGGAKTEIFPCIQEQGTIQEQGSIQEQDASPGVPRGVYLCTVLVEHGGRWQFSGVVNRLRADPDDPPVPLGRATTDLDIVTTEVAPSADENQIKGRLAEVALLWGHSGAAALWFVAVSLIGILALPPLRRRLSALGLHRLEERFDLMAKSLWAATGLLVTTGTFLLLNQTAYETPFSSARIEAAFRLPYGKPYFLTLAAKLTIYAVMVAAGVVLHSEARRRLRAGVVTMPVELEDVSPWRVARPGGPGGGRPEEGVPGRTAVATRAPATVETHGAASEPAEATRGIASAGAAVLVAGAVGLSLSITLLKYFHELIEAARALL